MNFTQRSPLIPNQIIDSIHILIISPSHFAQPNTAALNNSSPQTITPAQIEFSVRLERTADNSVATQ